MLLALDTDYGQQIARTGAVAFDTWRAPAASLEALASNTSFGAYQPGRFFERELPCLLPLIAELRAQIAIETIVIDGFVDLGPDRPGLGRHLFEALGGEIAIVGVAKTAFRGAIAVEVLRGVSVKPLFVTSTGDLDAAAAAVRAMAGAYRVPDLLRRVDRLSRTPST